MHSQQQPSTARRVWVTVVDPEREEGRAAITSWDARSDVEWSVPDGAESGDYVLAWVTGGTGFRYLLEISDTPRTATEDEFGPQQASLEVVEPIEPSLPMTRLKADPVLRSWWIVRYNMQGVVRAQEQSLTLDPPWGVFLQILDTTAPNVTTLLRGTGGEGGVAPAAGGASQEGQAATETVSLLYPGATLPQQTTVDRGLADVLVRASAINERRGENDASFSSLLLALVHGKDPLGVWLAGYFDTQGVKIEHTLGRVEKGAEAAVAAAERGMARRAEILAEPLRCTPSAQQALEEASKIAGAQRVPVGAAHLVAALLALTDYHEQDFGALTLDRQRWGAAFVQFIARQATDASDVEFWRRFYTRRFPGHPLPPLEVVERQLHRPDYDADAYTANDLLSIDDEVSALAYVIASRQTQPPLAVGLFGEWGSGKTFFMKHLRQRIDRLCAGARSQPASKRDCHAHIAQIEFNAWHYQEGNLWASLVDHILRNLRFGEDEEETKLAERRDQMVRELDATEAREAAAAARADAADKRVDAAEKKVGDLQQEAAKVRAELLTEITPERIMSATRTGVALSSTLQARAAQVANETGLPIAQGNVRDLQVAIDESRRELTSVWAFLVPLFKSPDRTRRAVMLLTAVAVPLVLVILLDALLAQYEIIKRLATVVTGVGTFAAAATRWLRSQAEWVRQARTQLEPVAQDLEKAVDADVKAQLAVQQQTIAAKLAELENLRAAQAQARQERDTAAAQAVALRSTIAVLGDDGLMRAFLDDRIGGGVYQRKLGIAALVRRDFERLSRKIAQVSGRESDGSLKQGELVINRIVLYIDDLDRCEMDKVVPVLRAVHLLLAFPAFVVVVGVDSRWVARCLAQHHPQIFVEEGEDGQASVTPLDYLEKIFQIPIWLEPVPPDRRVFMVRELMRRPLPAAPPEPAPAQDKEIEKKAIEGDAVPGVAQAASQPAAPAPQAPVPAQSNVAPAEPERKGTRLDLNPPGLSITDGEYEFLGHLGGLLSSSPRTIKRFVNTYRLINVSLAQAGFRDSDHGPRDSEIRMLLLAVLVGMPELSRWLQEALRTATGDNLALTPLVDVMEKQVAARRVLLFGRDDADNADNAITQWSMVHDWIERRGEPWTTMPAARVVQWLAPVGRYTFNLRRTAQGQKNSSSFRLQAEDLPA